MKSYKIFYNNKKNNDKLGKRNQKMVTNIKRDELKKRKMKTNLRKNSNGFQKKKKNNDKIK